MREKTITLGDFRKATAGLPDSTPIFSTSYYECITDAGTDMGGEEEEAIKSVVDLESRIVLETERCYIGGTKLFPKEETAA